MKEIEKTLTANADMTEEEYAKMTGDADAATEAHGEGKTKLYAGKPISEATRHKRIQSNFYGTAVNILLNIFVELKNISATLEKMKEKGDAD